MTTKQPETSSSGSFRLFSYSPDNVLSGAFFLFIGLSHKPRDAVRHRAFQREAVFQKLPHIGGTDAGQLRKGGEKYGLQPGVKPLHDVGFDLDESILKRGAAMYAQVAVDYLEETSK